MNKKELKSFLEEKYNYYDQLQWVQDDPISIPHRFTKKQDIEISGFLAAVIAWGNRKSILNNAEQLLQIMDHAPHDFIINHQADDLEKCKGFVHRTFNESDLQYFLMALQRLYKENESMDDLFQKLIKDKGFSQLILSDFKAYFFQIDHPFQRKKHLSDPRRNSAAKRLICSCAGWSEKINMVWILEFGTAFRPQNYLVR